MAIRVQISGKAYPNPEDPESYEPEKVFQGFTGPIVAMTWDPTGSEGVVGASDGNPARSLIAASPNMILSATLRKNIFRDKLMK